LPMTRGLSAIDKSSSISTEFSRRIDHTPTPTLPNVTLGSPYANQRGTFRWRHSSEGRRKGILVGSAYRSLAVCGVAGIGVVADGAGCSRRAARDPRRSVFAGIPAPGAWRCLFHHHLRQGSRLVRRISLDRKVRADVVDFYCAVQDVDVEKKTNVSTCETGHPVSAGTEVRCCGRRPGGGAKQAD